MRTSPPRISAPWWIGWKRSGQSPVPSHESRRFNGASSLRVGRYRWHGMYRLLPEFRTIKRRCARGQCPLEHSIESVHLRENSLIFPQGARHELRPQGASRLTRISARRMVAAKERDTNQQLGSSEVWILVSYALKVLSGQTT